MRQNDFSGLLPACCRIGFASIDQYDADEQSAMRTFLPDVHTIIVVAHHVMHSLEWTWFAFDAEPACAGSATRSGRSRISSNASNVCAPARSARRRTRSSSPTRSRR
jgi:hypothetical protein